MRDKIQEIVVKSIAGTMDVTEAIDKLLLLNNGTNKLKKLIVDYNIKVDICNKQIQQLTEAIAKARTEKEDESVIVDMAKDRRIANELKEAYKEIINHLNSMLLVLSELSEVRIGQKFRFMSDGETDFRTIKETVTAPRGGVLVNCPVNDGDINDNDWYFKDHQTVILLD